ncbi:MAG: hypothetical protein QHH07_10485 [Sedimentisphaerales bacterium]|nr:hypothetical protein [Sedimentisphaerales bacterium]
MFKRLGFWVLSVLLLTLVIDCALGQPGGWERARRVHHRYRDRISALPEVVGSAVGEDEQDGPVIHVLLERLNGRGLPRTIEGIPVRPIVTGKIYSLAFGWRPSRQNTNPYYYNRPVPIGVSTGNANEGSAGTIACRLIHGSGNVYALSNNHVYALENGAEIGDIILQPGLYDIKDYVGNEAKYFLGYLEDFCTIDFAETAENRIDAAIAFSTTGYLGNRTPAGGYGLPKSNAMGVDELKVRLPVTKYGRTTKLTTGRIYALNATVKVQYSSGVARFVDQILITPGSFSKAGDSGSLVVAADAANYRRPVGLLFAGSSTVTVANPIEYVLDHFELDIDGE